MKNTDLLTIVGMWLSGLIAFGLLALGLGAMFRFFAYMFCLSYGC